jgi:hypothetical protein
MIGRYFHLRAAIRPPLSDDAFDPKQYAKKAAGD